MDAVYLLLRLLFRLIVFVVEKKGVRRFVEAESAEPISRFGCRFRRALDQKIAKDLPAAMTLHVLLLTYATPHLLRIILLSCSVLKSEKNMKPKKDRIDLNAGK